MQHTELSVPHTAGRWRTSRIISACEAFARSITDDNIQAIQVVDLDRTTWRAVLATDKVGAVLDYFAAISAP